MNRIELIATLPEGTIGAEIGVYRGFFSEQLLKLPIRHLHLIDCWEEQKGDYEKDPSNLNQGGHDTNYREVQEKFNRDICEGRVTLHKKFSNKAVDDFDPSSLDWVYIDADHTYHGCLNDLIRWSTRVKFGGSIFGHDYVDNAKTRSMGFEVIQAVQVFCSNFGWKIVQITDEDWPSYQLKRNDSEDNSSNMARRGNAGQEPRIYRRH